MHNWLTLHWTQLGSLISLLLRGFSTEKPTCIAFRTLPTYRLQIVSPLASGLNFMVIFMLPLLLELPSFVKMMIVFKHNARLNSPYYRFIWPWHAAALTFIISDTWMILLMSHYQIWNHWREKDLTITLNWSRTCSTEGCPRTSLQNLVNAELKAQKINIVLKYRKNVLDWDTSDDAELEVEHNIHEGFMWAPKRTPDLWGSKTPVTCPDNQHLPFFLCMSDPQSNQSFDASMSSFKASDPESNNVSSPRGQKRVEINLSTAGAGTRCSSICSCCTTKLWKKSMRVEKKGSTHTAHREALNKPSSYSYNSQNTQATLLSVMSSTATISDWVSTWNLGWKSLYL